ncbi:hypothetical protein GE061_007823 [Apolygus lucorum]|uniref:Uncharacterized protein n=1 Tax=Apolygus lucorum TaxID=248454 RepID=A0A8S9WMY3_APOLU|nr:hypothetical protein GE061_007823 [Apolygus lucorum]
MQIGPISCVWPRTAICSVVGQKRISDISIVVGFDLLPLNCGLSRVKSWCELDYLLLSSARALNRPFRKASKISHDDGCHTLL